MSLISIDIATEFKGKKAFDQAGKSVSALDKAVNKLGKQIAGVFAVTKVVAFGKASLKAFVEDEAAATRLATSVKNLGLAFAQPEIDEYISKLESSSAVADDMLRPAFQALLTTTGSLADSQRILGIALETSRGTGIELTTVAKDLGNAYVGNTRGLRRYNLGLTQAELKTVSFAEVQARLTKQFSGSNAAFLDTYAGKLQVLTVAAGNAQEVIGKGLVDALVLAGGKDTDVQDVADAMRNLSVYTSDVIRGIGVLTGKLNNFSQSNGFGLKDFVTLIPILGGYISALEKAGRESRPRPRANREFRGGSGGNLFDLNVSRQSKIDKERARLAAQQLKAQKALAAEQKKQAMAKKQSALFDLEQIQLIAALKGNLSKEEQDRVKLQLALLTGNTAEADKLSQKIAMSIDSTGALARSLKDLPDANNPFKNWDAYLDTVLVKAKEVARLGSGGAGGGGGTGGLTTVQTNAVSTTVFNSIGSANASTRTADEAARLYGGMGPSKIVVQIDGKEIASAVQTQSLTGNNPIVDRLLGQFR
jgi:hypothetical protein